MATSIAEAAPARRSERRGADARATEEAKADAEHHRQHVGGDPLVHLEVEERVRPASTETPTEGDVSRDGSICSGRRSGGIGSVAGECKRAGASGTRAGRCSKYADRVRGSTACGGGAHFLYSGHAIMMTRMTAVIAGRALVRHPASSGLTFEPTAEIIFVMRSASDDFSLPMPGAGSRSASGSSSDRWAPSSKSPNLPRDDLNVDARMGASVRRLSAEGGRAVIRAAAGAAAMEFSQLCALRRAARRTY